LKEATGLVLFSRGVPSSSIACASVPNVAVLQSLHRVSVVKVDTKNYKLHVIRIHLADNLRQILRIHRASGIGDDHNFARILELLTLLHNHPHSNSERADAVASWGRAHNQFIPESTKLWHQDLVYWLKNIDVAVTLIVIHCARCAVRS